MDLNSLLHAHNKIMADRATNTTVRNNNTTDQQQANTPPPAYSTLTSHRLATTTATPNPTPTPDDPDDLYTSSSTPSPTSTGGTTTPSQTLAIDAATLIHGSNNIITVPPVDGPRLTAILLSLLHGNLPTQQAAARHQHHQHQQTQAFPVHHPGHLPGGNRSRPLSVRINCGVRIVGDRNVLGGVLSQQGQQGQQGGGARVAGWNGNGGAAAAAAAAVARNAAGGAPPGEQEAGGRKRKAEEEEEEEEEEGSAGRGGVKRERVGGGDVKE